MSDLGLEPSSEGDVAGLAPLVRRVVGARVSDASTVNDLVQETLTRVLAASARLDPSALAPYAVVTARNLVRSLARAEERGRRNAPRLLDPSRPEDPEERAVQSEDRRALADALAQLSPLDQQFLVAHEVEGVETAVLAERTGASTGSVAVRLSRARANLRMEYLLALRRVELPTPRCKPVLLALSTGDKRRQRQLEAGEHLLECPSCAALSEPLSARRRVLAGAWPGLGLGRLVSWLRRRAADHPVQTAATAAGAATAAVVAALALSAGPGEPPPPPPLVVQGNPPVAFSGAQPMAPYAGRTVEARGVRVLSAAGQGFWVGTSEADRVFVEVDDGTNAPPRVAVGQRVSFVGRLVANAPEHVDELGLTAPADQAQLERQGHHIDVAGFR